MFSSQSSNFCLTPPKREEHQNEISFAPNTQNLSPNVIPEIVSPNSKVTIRLAQNEPAQDKTTERRQ